MSPFLQPDYTGIPDLTGPSLAFLIEHPSNKKILFDLGVRHDWQRLPSYPKFRQKGWGIMVQKDVARILQEANFDVADGSISSIIMSHHHWDHTGDPTTFPPSTEIIVGPGFKDAHLPGYPNNPDATLLQSDYENRTVREIDFSQASTGFKIGRFDAHDFFGDGSFYLLNAPGHSVGHMCGLARTTTNPLTFVFMAGDASHHAGEFRPTEYLPLPEEIALSAGKNQTQKYSGSEFQHIHPEESATKPFYNVTASFAHDKALADWTIEGLGEFDCQENVLLLTAHDEHVIEPSSGFQLFPATLNDWYDRGLGRKVKWLFLRDFVEAVEANKKGDEAFVWGQSL